ncbi:hypothetical protein [Sinorhizobium sp. RAC02]|uniref:hypothetical protein n=1 Tax=Sinorhizobium sp. RAC02 TaxID=1842534 RepID=UPI00083DADBA|nr:hypothetical protein [Sinorhizobium sp. RAC02]AOF89481.1 putative lipoprotein [Sinorhizobium sp. RAC02]
MDCRVIGLLLAVFFFSTSCDNQNPPIPDVDFLSRDAHFSIADETVVLPFVALSGASVRDANFQAAFDKASSSDDARKQLVKQANDPERPVSARSLRMSIALYGSYNEMSISRKICPLLSRMWARQLCTGLRSEELADLPGSFELMDIREISMLKSHTTVGRERVFDQIVSMQLTKAGLVQTVCDRDPSSKFCSAAVVLDDHLLAHWTVWSGDETAEHMANRQGIAIVRFIDRHLRY